MLTRRIRLNIDVLIKKTKAAKIERTARPWHKNAETGEMTQTGTPSYLPCELEPVVDDPNSPTALQLEAKMQEIQGIMGAGIRIWVSRPGVGKKPDTAYCVRFDKGVPEVIDGYCSMPPRAKPNLEDGFYEEQDSVELPTADDDGWVSVGPGSFHVEQGTRGDVDDFYAASLKGGSGKE